MKRQYSGCGCGTVFAFLFLLALIRAGCSHEPASRPMTRPPLSAPAAVAHDPRAMRGGLPIDGGVNPNTPPPPSPTPQASGYGYAVPPPGYTPPPVPSSDESSEETILTDDLGFQVDDPDDAAKTVRVRGYYRKDGTYVRPHYRRPPSH